MLDVVSSIFQQPAALQDEFLFLCAKHGDSATRVVLASMYDVSRTGCAHHFKTVQLVEHGYPDDVLLAVVHVDFDEPLTGRDKQVPELGLV